MKGNKKRKKRNIPIRVICKKCTKEFDIKEKDFEKQPVNEPSKSAKFTYICPYCLHTNCITLTSIK